jgi:hypothetical protein
MVAWRAAPVALLLLGVVGFHPALNPITEPMRERFTMDMTSDLDPTSPVESTSAASLPLHAAVVEHTAAGSTIAVFDPKSPGLKSIVSHPQPPDSLGWCAPKPLLLYSMGSRLLMHDGKEEEILQGLDKDTPTPFVCSPDGRFLAAARPEAVLLISTEQLPSVANSRKFPLPAPCRILSMLWSQDGRVLNILCYPARSEKVSQLLRVEVNTGQVLTLPAHGATRLLGWRGTPPALLIARDHSFAEEAGTLDKDGNFHSFCPGAPPAFVGPYLRSTDELVASEPSEDPGDPTSLRLERAGAPTPKPWLAHFHRIHDMSVSADGRWVLFVNKSGNDDDPGGDVYFIEAGKENATRLLRASPGKVSYTLPVPSP